MKKTVLLFTLVFGFLSCTHNQKNTVKERPFYGAKIDSKKAIPVDQIIKEFDSYKDRVVTMEAKVEKVCAKKGCWMILQGTNETFRVKFEDYSFFVPLSLVGKTVWAQGKIMKKEISIADTKHYLEDAGASKEEVDAITKPSFEYRMMATGIVKK